MLLRPVDSSGDVLPVLFASSCLTGAEAVVQLAAYRLRLLKGEWWESPSRGCEILDRLQDSRLSAASAEELAAYLTTFLLETEGVLSVTEVAFSVSPSDRTFSFSCILQTVYGPSDTLTFSL